MPSPPPAEIDMTTDTIVSVQDTATLVLPENTSAIFRSIEPSGVRFIWIGLNNTVTTETGKRISAEDPFVERQISTFTALYLGPVWAIHNRMGETVDVKVLEGESA